MTQETSQPAFAPLQGRQRSIIAPADVSIIGRNPIVGDVALRFNYVYLIAANELAKSRLKPVLAFGIFNRRNRAPWFRPEVCVVVRPAKAKRYKMVDFIVRMRACLKAITDEDRVGALARHVAQGRRRLAANLVEIS